MKIGLDCGHTLNSADYGASGIQEESILTRELGKKVKQLFLNEGHKVVDCTCDNSNTLVDSLSYRTTMANINNVDYYISIHFNAFNKNANGCEILYYSSVDARMKGVLDKLCSLGFTNRGFKQRQNLYVLKNTNAKAMLIEVCFCDSSKDMKIYNTDKVAKAILEGFLNVSRETFKVKAGKVLEIQRLINKYVGNKITEDGIFGSETDKYLKYLPVQGTKMYNHDLTIWVQLRLGVYADGIYGSQTSTAVKLFQKQNNLHDDGIVNYYTYRKLILV